MLLLIVISIRTSCQSGTLTSKSSSDIRYRSMQVIQCCTRDAWCPPYNRVYLEETLACRQGLSASLHILGHQKGTHIGNRRIECRRSRISPILTGMEGGECMSTVHSLRLVGEIAWLRQWLTRLSASGKHPPMDGSLWCETFSDRRREKHDSWASVRR